MKNLKESFDNLYESPVEVPVKPKTKPKQKPGKTNPLKPSPGQKPKPKAKKRNKDVELFVNARKGSNDSKE